MEVSGRHARARAIISDAVLTANRNDSGAGDASRDVARVVSDVSDLCPRAGVYLANARHLGSRASHRRRGPGTAGVTDLAQGALRYDAFTML
jgi:hypothetical protein